ncbi:hypothetical protein CRYUN_Cryun01aG0066000 [Craigia yunnanensis]
MSSKGKGKAEEAVSGKRKSSAGRCLGGTEESRRKRKNTGVLQFFDDTAEVDDNDASDDSDIDNYFMEEEPDLNVNNEPGKTHNLPFVPKEEACKGLSYIYSSRVAPVPSKEVYHLLTVRTKHGEVSEGMWARVKNGKYKGDLAQGGGVSINRTITPAPKLISSIELKEFRPLIQYRRDRETGIGFQILDGMLLKDGYLYKKVSLDSLSCWGVMPTEEELLKFSHSDNNESDDLEWLS